MANDFASEMDRISPAIKRPTPALIPLNVIKRPKKPILPPIIRLVSAKNSNATEANTFSSDRKHEDVVAAKQKKTDSNFRAVVKLKSSPNKLLEDQSTVNSTKDDFVPTLQELPANYETILIDFQ